MHEQKHHNRDAERTEEEKENRTKSQVLAED